MRCKRCGKNLPTRRARVNHEERTCQRERNNRQLEDDNFVPTWGVLAVRLTEVGVETRYHNGKGQLGQRVTTAAAPKYAHIIAEVYRAAHASEDDWQGDCRTLVEAALAAMHRPEDQAALLSSYDLGGVSAAHQLIQEIVRRGR